MASCPHCGQNVPARAVWQGYGLSGIVCPHCNTSLEPKYWSSFLLFLVSWSLGWIVRLLLVRAGVAMPWPLVGLMGGFVSFYALLLPLILRLRLKDSHATVWPTRGA